MEKILELQIKQPVSFKKTVTLPEEVLTILNIGPRDEIVFRVKDGQVGLFSAFRFPVSTRSVHKKVFSNSKKLKLPKDIKVEYQIYKVITKDSSTPIISS